VFKEVRAYSRCEPPPFWCKFGTTYIREGKAVKWLCTTGLLCTNFLNCCYWKNSTKTVKDNGSCHCGCHVLPVPDDCWMAFVNDLLSQSINVDDFDWLSHFITDVWQLPKFNGLRTLFWLWKRLTIVRHLYDLFLPDQSTFFLAAPTWSGFTPTKSRSDQTVQAP